MTGKRKTRSHRPRAGALKRTDPLLPGMPAPDSVAETTEFTSPQGAKYTILKTTETDAYDPPLAISKARRKHG